MIFAFDSNIQMAFDLIENGSVIILPTDTLYGFSCDAFNPDPICKLNEMKGRKSPLSIIVSDIDMAQEFAFLDQKQQKILKKYLPGPFTFLLKKKMSKLAEEITNDSEKIGLRIPSNKMLFNLVKNLNRPIVTTSVNKTEMPALLEPEKMREEFPEVTIFEDKMKNNSIGSTIVDLTTLPYKILRMGDGKWRSA
tara:strand:+ start:726 stop:1307 length:582 start_codon:yes stop_codon:yes gene_type:complete